MAQNQEFLALYYQTDIPEIKRCLTKTATIHKTTTAKVTKIVIDATEMKFHLLPIEVIIPMIAELPVKSIINLCKTSRKFAAICDDNGVWKFLLKRDYIVEWARKEGAKEEYIRRVRFGSMVSCGRLHTGFITKKGELYMWGANFYGQLGNNRTSQKGATLPTLIKGHIFTQVSCGNHYTGAVTAKGELYMWGFNYTGQLGDGTRDNKKIPTLIKIEGNPKISQVSCYNATSGAVTKEGKLYMWGANHWGQLGDSSTDDKKIPTLIKIKGRVAQVSCGNNHTGILTTEGKLYMMGSNMYGQLGGGAKLGDRQTPILVKIKGNPRIVQVSCGAGYTGAVTGDGHLYIWGNNNGGQLGDGTRRRKKRPKLIMKNIAQVSCSSHTGAVTREGRLLLWGNVFSTSCYTKPISLSIKREAVIQISCGENYTGVVTAKGKLYMWGEGGYGRLGGLLHEGLTRFGFQVINSKPTLLEVGS